MLFQSGEKKLKLLVPTRTRSFDFSTAGIMSIEIATVLTLLQAK